MLQKNIAKAILTSLASGTVPIKYSHLYNVGRDRQVETVLDEIIEGKSKLRFVSGDYGTGKTHFLSTIRHKAIENQFIPSHVILSPRETPIYNLQTVYTRILKNLIIIDDNVYSPIEAVLEFVYAEFEKWLKGYIQNDNCRCEKTLINSLYCSHCNLNGTIEGLYINDFFKLDRRLQVAIMVYRYARRLHSLHSVGVWRRGDQ